MSKIVSMNAKKLKEVAESYRTTVSVLLCFLSVTTWDGKKKKEGVKYSFGRKMSTTKENKVSKENEITPDLLIQVNENESYVCEAKSSLPKDRTRWLKEIEQLQKYDDNLIGWWTSDERVNSSNIVLLIEIGHSKNLSLYADELEKNEGILFTNSNAFVEYTRTVNTEDNIFFRLERGSINNKHLNQVLVSGIKVPLERVIYSYGNIKFYDSKPEPEYLMEVLWSHLFNNMKDEMPFNDKKKAWIIRVDVNIIAKEIQKLYGHQSNENRERCFPRIQWIREALDHFVAMKLGEKITDDNYNIFYKSIRSDLLEKFNTSRKYMKEIEEKKRQLSLKFDSPNTKLLKQ